MVEQRFDAGKIKLTFKFYVINERGENYKYTDKVLEGNNNNHSLKINIICNEAYRRTQFVSVFHLRLT